MTPSQKSEREAERLARWCEILADNAKATAEYLGPGAVLAKRRHFLFCRIASLLRRPRPAKGVRVVTPPWAKDADVFKNRLQDEGLERAKSGWDACVWEFRRKNKHLFPARSRGGKS